MGLSGSLILFIGLAEVAGALGLLLPAGTRVKPGLTPLAAIGLAIDMALATGFHVTRGEFSHADGTLFLGALAVFVVWGRARASPIATRRKAA